MNRYNYIILTILARLFKKFSAAVERLVPTLLALAAGVLTISVLAGECLHPSHAPVISSREPIIQVGILAIRTLAVELHPERRLLTPRVRPPKMNKDPAA